MNPGAESRVVASGPVRWHVEVQGKGPAALLLHGTGASGHSFDDLGTILAGRFTVIVPDLPGHALTSAARPFQPSLHGMAAAVRDLVQELGVTPEIVVGHSAGAAVAVQMALDGALKPRLLVGIAAALVPFRGAARVLFPPAARLLARTGLLGQLVALQARRRGSVERLVKSTGSALDERGVEAYRHLARRPQHVNAVLEMLSLWDIDALHAALPRLEVPLLLIAGEEDRAVPVKQQQEIGSLVRQAHLVVIEGAGHLVHEEKPAEVARRILEALG